LAVDTPVKLASGFAYTQGSFLWVVNNIFFQYYSLLITLVCIGVMVVVSYMTEKPAYDKIRGLTYATMTEEDHRQSRSSWGAKEVAASGLVLAIILMAYLSFTG